MIRPAQAVEAIDSLVDTLLQKKVSHPTVHSATHEHNLKSRNFQGNPPTLKDGLSVAQIVLYAVECKVTKFDRQNESKFLYCNKIKLNVGFSL